MYWDKELVNGKMVDEIRKKIDQYIIGQLM
jgi:hypothetical protein